MSEEKIRVNLNGQPVWAVRVPVVNADENFNTYLLGDGTVLKLKTITVDVLRILDVLDAEGNPVFVLKSKNVLDIQPSSSGGKGDPK